MELAKGDNYLLIKIVNNGGPGGMYFKLGGSSLPKEVLANLGQDVLSEEHVAKLREYYEKSVWPLAKQLDEKIKAAEKSVNDYNNGIVTVMTMGDLAKPRKTYVLSRGHYASPIKDEEIFPNVPKVLPSLPKDAPAKAAQLGQSGSMTIIR